MDIGEGCDRDAVFSRRGDDNKSDSFSYSFSAIFSSSSSAEPAQNISTLSVISKSGQFSSSFCSGLTEGTVQNCTSLLSKCLPIHFSVYINRMITDDRLSQQAGAVLYRLGLALLNPVEDSRQLSGENFKQGDSSFLLTIII